MKRRSQHDRYKGFKALTNIEGGFCEKVAKRSLAIKFDFGPKIIFTSKTCLRNAFWESWTILWNYMIQLHRRQLCGFVIWWSLPLIQVADILRQKSRLFPITLWRKSVSQASSNGFGSLNLLVNIFGDGFVVKKLLLETRWERQQRAYSDNPYDIKEIDVILSSFVG